MQPRGTLWQTESLRLHSRSVLRLAWRQWRRHKAAQGQPALVAGQIQALRPAPRTTGRLAKVRAVRPATARHSSHRATILVPLIQDTVELRPVRR
jgi:hypothetical protein